MIFNASAVVDSYVSHRPRLREFLIGDGEVGRDGKPFLEHCGTAAPPRTNVLW